MIKTDNVEQAIATATKMILDMEYVAPELQEAHARQKAIRIIQIGFGLCEDAVKSVDWNKEFFING